MMLWIAFAISASFYACDCTAIADSPLTTPAAEIQPEVSPEVIPLWTDGELGNSSADDSETRRERTPGDAWVGTINRPTLTVYRPSAKQTKVDDGTTVTDIGIIICPGGGYGGLAIDKEGHDVARWLAGEGITAGVLKYRLGGGPNKHPVPMKDARQAVRVFRAHAEQWQVNPKRVGILGFSAGGHLAATIATDPESAVNFSALIYPVISMAEGVTHSGSKKNLLGDSPSDQLVHEMSRDEQVSPLTGPVFLVHAADDQAVPVENSIRFYQACVRHSVAAEMHLFPEGGHGFGMFRGNRPVDGWPELLREWLLGYVFDED